MSEYSDAVRMLGNNRPIYCTECREYKSPSSFPQTTRPRSSRQCRGCIDKKSSAELRTRVESRKTLQDAIIEFLQRTVDPDIFRRTHAFKVGALARKQAYEFMYTPAARAAGASYPEVADMMETYLSRKHAEIRADRRSKERSF